MTVKSPPRRELYGQLAEALQKYKGKKGQLIPALREAQQIFGYLPRKVMILVAHEMDIPLAEVYSVVSFYSLFSTRPVGQKKIEICMGTACYVKGAAELLEMIADNLGIKPGEMTPDGRFSLTTSRCVGACSSAPVVKVGEDLHGNVTPEKAAALISALKEEAERGEEGG
ncbi:MAG: NAD(P)H-dependent oxidoreductase subunit E [Firmicutes bacterium]|nr:NAD(P)H-dependent oxidoreductase subunit E [Bacillota bacterium]